MRVRGLYSTTSGRSVPDRTLQSEIRPAWGSVTVLQTTTRGWPSGSQATSAVVSPARTRAGGRWSGEGHSSTSRRASRSTPTPVAPEQHRTGKTAAEATPPARAASSSARSIDSPSR